MRHKDRMGNLRTLGISEKKQDESEFKGRSETADCLDSTNQGVQGDGPKGAVKAEVHRDRRSGEVRRGRRAFSLESRKETVSRQADVALACSSARGPAQVSVRRGLLARR